MNRLLVASVTLAVAIFACRDSGGGGDDTNVDAPVNTDDVTIQMIQSSAITAGTAVNVKGVIVTVIDMYGGKTGDFWVQEPGGGEFSGVHVFGAELADVGALVPGDVVDIEGAEKDEFAYQGSNGSGGDTSGRSITELKPISGGKMKVTKVSSGTVPAPQVVNALTIGQKATQAEIDAEWEKWEGVLITVPNVSAVSSAACVGSMCNDDTLNKFNITGGIVVESALAPFPGYMPAMGTTKAVPGDIARAECLAGVTGVVDYFFDYLLLNTSTTNVMKNGTGCPVAEAAAQCTDSIDNDGNGYKDCTDNNCVLTEGTCRASTNIAAIQAATPMGYVSIDGVIVTALSKANAQGKRFNMWVQQNPGMPASNESVYVFGPGTDLTPFAVGSKVNLIAQVQEFNDATGTETLTELKPIQITAASGTAVTAPLTGKTAAELSVAATGEPYEGALVTLTNVKVTAVGTTGTGGTFGVGSMQQGTTTFKTDDDIFLVNSAVGTCFATITGIWTYMPYDNVYGFLPLAAGTGTGVCP